MLISVVRHAETTANHKNIVQGQTGGKLSSLGKQQVERLAQHLATAQYDAIYTSDLKRAFQTATKIAEQHQDTAMISDRRLREKDAGDLTGHKHAEAAKKIAATMKKGDTKRSYRPPGGGESWEDVNERAQNFLDDIVETYMNVAVQRPEAMPHILVVTHAGFIKEFLACVFKKRGRYTVLNTSITTIFFDKNGKVSLLRRNDVAHLGDLLRPSEIKVLAAEKQKKSSGSKSNASTSSSIVSSTPFAGLKTKETRALKLKKKERALSHSASSLPQLVPSTQSTLSLSASSLPMLDSSSTPSASSDQTEAAQLHLDEILALNLSLELERERNKGIEDMFGRGLRLGLGAEDAHIAVVLAGGCGGREG